MSTNEFLPVATEGVPNVLDQADYAASVNREQGWPTGGVPSAQEWNKMMRQGTFMAAVLAQYIAQQTGQDVLDNGNLDAMVALLSLSNRTKLLANTTFYVSTEGNDNNAGTAGSPWLTIQHAANVIYTLYDLNGFTATIQVADGAYTAGAIMRGALLGDGGNGLQIVGNTANPQNVTITSDGLDIFTAFNGMHMAVRGFKIKATSLQGVGIGASSGGVINFQNIIFDACTQAHIDANTGGLITATGDYSIVGGATYHLAALQAGEINTVGINVTLTGAPAFTNAFAQADHCGNIFANGNTYTGGATGQRYISNLNANIDTGGAGANYFPGDVAGATSLGGNYV